MATPPRLPSRPFTLYPRRCFPALPRRRHDAAGDRLLQYVVARLAPPTGPRVKLRPRPGAWRVRAVKPRRLSLRAAVGRWTELLRVWRYCDACLEGHRCKGDPLVCLPRHLPHLAPPVRLWFACVGIAAEKDVSFAEALALTDVGCEQACARWHVAVGEALCSAGRRRSGEKDA